MVLSYGHAGRLTSKNGSDSHPLRRSTNAQRLLAASRARWQVGDHGTLHTFLLSVRALPGRLSGLSVPHIKSVLYGAFAWARGALNSQKRWFPARAAKILAAAAGCLASAVWMPLLIVQPSHLSRSQPVAAATSYLPTLVAISWSKIVAKIVTAALRKKKCEKNSEMFECSVLFLFCPACHCRPNYYYKSGWE